MKKLWYYTKNFSNNNFFKKIYEYQLNSKLNQIKQYDINYINQRVNYYNKLHQPFILENPLTWKNYKRSTPISINGKIDRQKQLSAYYFDFKESLIYFNKNNSFETIFTDLTEVPQLPSFVKSRPIHGNNQNSVLLKLDKLRHFRFVNDHLSFKDKKNAIVFRGQCHVPHRQEFIEKSYNLPNSNFGDTMKSNQIKPYYKDYLSIPEQLKYRYVLSIEGVDVATNLKWIMNSNSLCFMVKPKFETWFMEGTLIPNHHYVLLKDDYSDIQEKMDYYDKNPEEALKIIKNANNYVEQFKNKNREKIISLLVLEKYFNLNKTISK
ncbi:lipopolysaccharide A protein [Francisella halioticida]|uniref:Lipopolysaccharide A protein n=1 Tax=Francisella halioticida TaxID=549298 RepID=A0ABM6LXZ6_9GAMM|nr:glycosyl transferase family 90 [Francisella halioticida]ASG67556.1 lipopolysaccharide A protein [Francisella halioticida]